MCNLLLGQNNREGENMSFSQVLRNSLSVEKTTPAFCETCKKFTPTNQYARVTELPQILSINCGLKNEKEMNFLKRQLNRNFPTNASPANDMPAAPSSSTPIKPCRYGTNCSRVDCHFAHSDRKSPAASLVNSSNASSSNGNSRSNIWFPHHFTMEIDEAQELKIQSAIDIGDESAGSNKSTDKLNDVLNISDLTITADESTNNESDQGDDKKKVEDDGDKSKDTDKNDAQTAKNDTEPETNDTNEHKVEEKEEVGAKQKEEETKIIKKSYKLTAVVCQVINGNQKNLVALISVGKQYHKAKKSEYDESQGGQWYIFNDFR